MYRLNTGFSSIEPPGPPVIALLNDLMLPGLPEGNIKYLLRSSSDIELEAEGSPRREDRVERGAATNPNPISIV